MARVSDEPTQQPPVTEMPAKLKPNEVELVSGEGLVMRVALKDERAAYQTYVRASKLAERGLTTGIAIDVDGVTHYIARIVRVSVCTKTLQRFTPGGEESAPS